MTVTQISGSRLIIQRLCNFQELNVKNEVGVFWNIWRPSTNTIAH